MDTSSGGLCSRVVSTHTRCPPGASSSPIRRSAAAASIALCRTLAATTTSKELAA